MNRKEILGAWYSDNTLEGDFACLFSGSKILVHDAILNIDYELALPGENVLFLKLYRSIDKLFICGQGGGSGNAWVLEIGNSKWVEIGVCFGTWGPCLFANGLFYRVNHPGQNYSIYKLDDLTNPIISLNKQIGVNGIRQVLSDGTIITGDSTYNGSDTVINLAEYTTWNNINAGQSYIDGAVVVNNNKRVMIEPGDCKFIQYHCFGNELAFTIVKQIEKKVIFYWMSVNELISFPPEGTIIIPPVEPPVPNQPPNYETALNNVKTRLLAAGHNLQGQSGGKICRQFAYEHRTEGFGLLSKPQGTNWEGCSVDYLCYGSPSNYNAADVVIACGEANIINWPEFKQNPGEENRFLVVNEDPGYFSVAPPIDPPPISNLEQRVKVLENEVDILQLEIAEMKQNMIQSGDKISLKTNDESHYLRAHDQGGLSRDKKPLATDSTGVGVDELFRLEKR